MRIVWRKHPITAADIIEKLTALDSTWHPKTARTLLARLVKKNALDYTQQGKGYIYNPLVTEHECVTVASQSFLARTFGGSLKPMLVHFVEAKQLTKKELEDLRSVLNSEIDNESDKPRRKPCK